MNNKNRFGEALITSLCKGDRARVRLKELTVFAVQNDSYSDCDCGCNVKERSNVQSMEVLVSLLQQYIENYYQSNQGEVRAPLTKVHVAQPWNDRCGNNGGSNSSPETIHATFGRKSRNSHYNHLKHPMSREHESRSGSETLSYDNHGNNYSTEPKGLRLEKSLEPSFPSSMHNMTNGDVPPADINSPKAVRNDQIAFSRDTNQDFDKSLSQQSSSYEGIEMEPPQQNNDYADEAENSLLPANQSQSAQFSLHLDTDSTSILAQNSFSSRLQESHRALTAELDQNRATNEGVVVNTVEPASLTLSNTLPERSSRLRTPKDQSTHIPASTEMPQLFTETRRTNAIPLTIGRRSSVGENTTIADKEPTLTSSKVLQPLDPSSLIAHEDHLAPTRSGTTPTAPVHSKDQLARLPMEWRFMLKRKRDGGSWNELAEYYKDLLGESIRPDALRMRYRTLCQKEAWLTDYVAELNVGRKRDASPIERLDRPSRARRAPSEKREEKEDEKRARPSRLRRHRSTITPATYTNNGTEAAFEEWYAQGSSQYHKIIENNTANSDEYRPESEDDNDMDNAPTSTHRRSSKHSVTRNAPMPSQPIFPNASEHSKFAGSDSPNASRPVAASLGTANWQCELNELPQDIQFVAKKRRDGVQWGEIMENYNLLTGKNTTKNAMRIRFTNLKKEKTWFSDYLSGRERIQRDTRSRHRPPSVESRQDHYEDDDDGEV